MLKRQNEQLSRRSGNAGGWAVYGTTIRLNNHVVVLCLFALLIQVCTAQDCGSQANNALCRDSLCCSQYGYCGVGSEYCGNGCQSNCNSTDATDPSQICGTAVNNTLCPDNQCCSEFGYCGSTSVYCGAGCQSGPCDSPAAGGDSGLKVWAKVVIAVAAVVAALTLGTAIFCCIKRRSRKQKLVTESRHLTSTGGQSLDSFHQPAGMTYIFSDNQKILGMRFTYEYLNAATNGFSKELGRGAFGVVYKGRLNDDTEVAVKSVLSSHRGLKDFEAEIKTLGNINHANLVALRGFCFEPNRPPYIVYEFAPNGSLDKWIFTTDKEESLPWKVRMNIARGTAKGLAYLHQELQIGQAIIHLDIKPENILLDENFTPKVADFGMAKLIGEKRALTMASGGTLGYMAPETYAGAASTKMDVYSFGMVLLELVCGRRHLNLSLLPNEEFYLPSWALRKVSANEETDILDPNLNGIFDATEARRLIIVALLCLRRDPDLRCDMGTVWRTLEELTSVPEIPEDLKTDLEMVERLLRRSSADNSLYSSDSRSTAASVFSLSSTGGAYSNSFSTSISFSEPSTHASEKTVQPNVFPELGNYRMQEAPPVDDSACLGRDVDISSWTEPGGQQYQRVERRSTSAL